MKRAADIKALLRQAIQIIDGEREIYFKSHVDPTTGEIPDAEARNEIRKWDRWLKKAKAVAA